MSRKHEVHLPALLHKYYIRLNLKQICTKFFYKFQAMYV